VGCVSFGVATVELLFGLESEAAWALSRCRGKPPAALIEAFLKGVGVVPESHAVVCVDCRFVSDPNLRLEKTHVGYHPTIVNDFVWHRDFRAWLRDLGVRVAAAAADAGDVTVVMYCRAGCHRSVAASVIWRHVLEATSQRWHLSDTVHLSREIWQQRKCGPCSRCAAKSEVRSAALARARQVWREIAAGVGSETVSRSDAAMAGHSTGSDFGARR
jgi:hypothetical protein